MHPLLIVAILGFIIILIGSFIRIIPDYQRAVVFRLGRVRGNRALTPGILFFIPLVDVLFRIDMRTLALDVPPQDIITKDNVSICVNAVVYFRVIDAVKAVTGVENFTYATSQISQTVLRSILGSFDLDELLTNQQEINEKLKSIIDERTDPWGIKVSLVEIKHIDLPSEMKRSMAKQAEAERERRAKIIMAEAECQAAMKLCEAAEMIEQHPAALQLRYLQTLKEIAVENNSTIAFPVPIELMKSFCSINEKKEN